MREYEVQRGHICFFSCFADIMKYNGINVSEEMILGLSTGINFNVYYNNDNNIKIECSDIYDNAFEIKRCLSLFGFKLDCHILHDTKEFMILIKKNLENDQPVMVSIDVFYLEYHIDYQKAHAGHDIVVYYIDNEKVYIADGYITTLHGSIYKGFILLEDFIKAIQLGEVIGENIQSLHTICKKSNMDYLRKSTLYKIMKDNILDFIGSTNKSKSFVENMKKLKDYISPINEEDLQLSNIIYNLNQIGIMINGLAGPVATRLLYSKFLRWGKSVCSIDIPETVIDEYTDLSGLWKVVGNLLFKISKTREINIKDRVLTRLNTIEKIETDLARKLCELDYGIDCEIYIKS